MAIQCIHCGQTLPREDARFCNNCGTTLLPQSSGPPAPASLEDSPVPGAEQSHDTKAMREQVAQQPPFRPPRRPQQEESRAVSGKGGNDEVREPVWSPANSSNAMWGEPLPSPIIREEHPYEGVELVQEEAPPEEIEAQALSERPTVASPSVHSEQAVQVASLNEAQALSERPTVASPSVHSEQAVQVASLNEAQALSERPTVASPSVHSEQAAGRDLSRPYELGQVASFNEKGNDPSNPVRNPTPTPSFSQPTPIPSVQEQQRQQKSRVSVFAAQRVGRGEPSGRPRLKSRVPLLVALALLSLLILGGIVASLYVFQPFSIPQVTQPQLHFQSSKLGFSLSYPNGWTKQEDQAHGGVHFSDSNTIAQFSIMVIAADSSSANLSMLAEVMQLGITGAKPATSLSIAGASWQQTQGTLQQDGVNYTITLLSTMHSNRLYLIVQRAPQATYTEEERVIFSGMRSSFLFL